MTSDTVNALADHLAKIDADWRRPSRHGSPILSNLNNQHGK